ncbi:T9SS type A sorting domain-containing protein [Aurantibacillus circumpalustris]|uniref:T9SS type A sorting domain-containing protein n=1 Tax=Aurantibacillus circumpalustris TaxID=3036359 RepID=UPI00295B26A2|nr:T9SS type A sorting domain-containing protein [Aurantibacillus circumpalustris]
MKKLYYIFFSVLLFVFTSRAQINIDFEATPVGTYTSASAVNGWTISSRTATSCNSTATWSLGSPEFSIIATPQSFLPNIGTLPNSPLGGTVVAQLNSYYSANSSVTRLAQTFSVTSLNAYIQFAYAGIWLSGTHSCCEQAGFKVLLYDQAGNPITCPSYTLAGAGCASIPTYTLSGNTSWTNWQIQSIYLQSYIGSNVTLEITNYDCTASDHYGTVFFDAKTSNCNCSYAPSNLPITNNFCAGSSLASIQAPVGYAQYLWTAPALYPISASQATLYSTSFTNAVVGNIYTLTVYPASPFCSFTSTFALANTSVSILGIGSNPSCTVGTSGSATVAAGGSGTGYTYTWTNSTNSIVANSPTLSSLAAGVYTVNITAAGAQSLSCGTATATTTVGTIPPGVIQLLKPFCGSEAYLSYPGGTNYQWYNNLSPITASLGGTASSYTVYSPINNSVYRLAYISNQNCHDSLKLTLVQVPSGNLSLASTPTICQGATNGTAVISMAPASGAPQGSNSFSVFSIGTTPPYSSTASSVSLNSFTAANLSAGSTYSVISFDGLCKYSTSFTVPFISFDYTLAPSNSPTLCTGNSIQASVTFSTLPNSGQYSYSWQPSTFLFSGNYPNAIISPSTNPGSVTTLTYTVVVTPTIANCPLTKTLSITIANPITPTINAIPNLCNSSNSVYTISANPIGGIYSNNAAITPNGILNGASAPIGQNTFTYAISIGTCIAKTAGTFTINSLPLISVSGNTLICEGQSTTLLANGANSYTWSNSSLSPFITINPSVTSSYSVEGKDILTNCYNSKTVVVTVEPYPVLSILGNTLLCAGQTTTLIANGASTYSWSNGFSSQAITVSPNVTNTYSIIGTSALANCSSTQAITVSVSNCNIVSIPNRNVDENFNIYPNPSSGKFLIESGNILSIVVSDELGRIILEDHFQKENYQLDLSAYSNGVYILKIFLNNEIKIVKLIKND